MAITLVTVVGTWLRQDGTTPASGQVTFTLSADIDDGVSESINAEPRVVALDHTGAISVVLPANDDSTTDPSGTFYTVTESIDGQTRSYSITLLHTVSPVNLAALR